MDIDLSILRMLEREKEISFEVLVEAIEQALLTAYHKTPGAQEQARVVLDRKSGHVTVLASEVDDDGNDLDQVPPKSFCFLRLFSSTSSSSLGKDSDASWLRRSSYRRCSFASSRKRGSAFTR